MKNLKKENILENVQLLRDKALEGIWFNWRRVLKNFKNAMNISGNKDTVPELSNITLCIKPENHAK